MHVRTFLLLAAMTALFGGIGFLLGGQSGMLIAFGVAVAMNVFAYWNSGSLVLRMYHAQEVDPHSAPDLYHLVAELANNARMPMPKVYYIHEDQPNAFATGRNPENGVVAVTAGLMRILNRQELAGVIAHELGHIRNRDTLMMTITATLAGAIGMLANMAMFMGGGRDEEGRPSGVGLIGGLVLMILAPLAASLVQMAISRTREYGADRAGVEICGDPRWLASALEKIEAYAQGTLNVTAERNPATAHMFIINPLSGEGADNLFSTHPSTRNRIARLMELGGGGQPPRNQGRGAWADAGRPNASSAGRRPWG